MSKHNAANERIKREYYQWLREAKGRNETSIDAIASAIDRFDVANGNKDFKRFHREQAVAFKVRLDAALAVRTGERLSRATVHSTLNALRHFFLWLADKPHYKSKIHYSDAAYFNLSEKDVRIANAKRAKPFPTLEQVHHVIANMPASKDIELRNRALIAFALLTGARADALASFKLKHVDLAGERVDQDARDVRTKFSKTFQTWFFPVGGDAHAIVSEWCTHLRTNLLWGENDTLFPATWLGLNTENTFTPIGLHRHGWNTTAPIREIFRKAFEAAGLPYYNPHSIRDTLAQLGERVCTTPEQFKAWSQNLGHEGVLTTFTSYGTVAAHRQAELIKGLGQARPDASNDDLAAVIVAAVRQHQGV